MDFPISHGTILNHVNNISLLYVYKCQHFPLEEFSYSHDLRV
jgi:hypothetical protein